MGDQYIFTATSAACHSGGLDSRKLVTLKNDQSIISAAKIPITPRRTCSPRVINEYKL